MDYKMKKRPKSMRKKVTARRHQPIDGRNNAPEWNDRFFVTTSVNNRNLHQYFREYFGKQPKEHAYNFRVKYANSTNELPGITDVHSRAYKKVKDFKRIPDQAHQNVKKLMHETRMPIKKG